MLLRNLWLSLPGFTMMCNRGTNCTMSHDNWQNKPERQFCQTQKAQGELSRVNEKWKT
jgi:hypothetical protein